MSTKYSHRRRKQSVPEVSPWIFAIPCVILTIALLLAILFL